MRTRILFTLSLAIALLACSSPTAAPTTPASGGGATPTAAAGTPGTATPTPAAATGTPAASAGGSGSTGTVDGNWSGTWTKPAGGGTMTLQLQQSGTSVSGKITLVGSACIPPDTAVSGTLTGPNIVFTVTASTLQATFGGNFSGNTITGTMTVACSAGSAVGTWNVTRG